MPPRCSCLQQRRRHPPRAPTSKLNWSSAPDVLVTYEGDPQVRVVDGQESGEVRLDRCDASVSVTPLVPVYSTPTAPLKVTAGSRSRAVVALRPQ